ncbi:hypothetical protein IV56_GL001141 [Lacticaseibacillus saniviri JCM 17471 = DSM 24301]|uniref:Uncharacterized protein n=3 Tax=Lacticaseibacillus saniviri TaxID=931533 RepID=A0A0R2MS05_9LACO|nr:hypothetical protein IV56_GL001141 [Lacticaseibacillus saniviri JCM 17471 = DSM 24301]
MILLIMAFIFPILGILPALYLSSQPDNKLMFSHTWLMAAFVLQGVYLLSLIVALFLFA